MPVEPLGGLKTHVQTLGHGGPAVVMLHGMFIGSIASWYFSIAPVLASGRRVVMYDLRGHGLTERTGGGYGLRAMAQHLDAVVDRFGGGGPVHLVGHSYGGAIALRYAVDRPGKVGRLAVVEAPLPVLTPEHVEAMKSKDGRAAVEMMPPWQQHAFLTGGRRARRLADRGIALLSETAMVEELLADPDIPDEVLAAYPGDVLLCYASETAARMTETLHRLARVMPGARPRVLDASHYLHRDAPAALAEVIREFLDA